MAMATGTAFDIMVKAALNKKINLEEELSEEVEPKNKAAILLAKEMFECYKLNALPALKGEGVAYTAIDSTIDLEWNEWKSVLNGRPDVVMSDGTVIDWKCQGMFGRGKIPFPGYIRCFKYPGGKDQGSSHTEQFLEQINFDWGVQLYLYARLLGRKAGDPKLKAGIENVTIDSSNNVYCASYRTLISTEFQLNIERQFHEKWAKFNYLTLNHSSGLMNHKPDPPQYHKMRCIKYNQLCNVAQYCVAYQNEIHPSPNIDKPLIEGLS